MVKVSYIEMSLSRFRFEEANANPGPGTPLTVVRQGVIGFSSNPVLRDVTIVNARFPIPQTPRQGNIIFNPDIGKVQYRLNRSWVTLADETFTISNGDGANLVKQENNFSYSIRGIEGRGIKAEQRDTTVHLSLTDDVFSMDTTPLNFGSRLLKSASIPVDSEDLINKQYLERNFSFFNWLPIVLFFTTQTTITFGPGMENTGFIWDDNDTTITVVYNGSHTIDVKRNEVITIIDTFDGMVPNVQLVKENSSAIIQLFDGSQTSYLFNGSDWIPFANIIAHNILNDLQGGSNNEFYHLNEDHFNIVMSQDEEFKVGGFPHLAGIDGDGNSITLTTDELKIGTTTINPLLPSISTSSEHEFTIGLKDADFKLRDDINQIILSTTRGKTNITDNLITSDIIVGGNLTVNGDTVTIRSETKTVRDNKLVLNEHPIISRPAGILVDSFLPFDDPNTILGQSDVIQTDINKVVVDIITPDTEGLEERDVRIVFSDSSTQILTVTDVTNGILTFDTNINSGTPSHIEYRLGAEKKNGLIFDTDKGWLIGRFTDIGTSPSLSDLSTMNVGHLAVYSDIADETLTIFDSKGKGNVVHKDSGVVVATTAWEAGLFSLTVGSVSQSFTDFIEYENTSRGSVSMLTASDALSVLTDQTGITGLSIDKSGTGDIVVFKNGTNTYYQLTSVGDHTLSKGSSSVKIDGKVTLTSGSSEFSLDSGIVKLTSSGSNSVSLDTTSLSDDRDLTFADGNTTLTAGTMVAESRTITAGTGITGGGNLSANRTLAIDNTVVTTVDDRSLAGAITFTGGATFTTNPTKVEAGLELLQATNENYGLVIGSNRHSISQRNGALTIYPNRISTPCFEVRSHEDGTLATYRTDLSLDDSGNFDINGKATMKSLDVNNGTTSVANVNETGDATFRSMTTTSDIRLKENVVELGSQIDELKKMRFVSYNLKDTEETTYGVIAQEVEEIDPNLVKEAEYKSVDYIGLYAKAMKAVQELIERNEQLEERVRLLENK